MVRVGFGGREGALASALIRNFFVLNFLLLRKLLNTIFTSPSVAELFYQSKTEKMI